MLRMVARQRGPRSPLAAAAPVAVVAGVIGGWPGLCVGASMMVVIAAVDTAFWLYALGRADRNVHRLLRRGCSRSQVRQLGLLSLRAQRDVLRARKSRLR